MPLSCMKMGSVSGAPSGTIALGTNEPRPSQGQMRQNGGCTAQFNREQPTCPRDEISVCPRRPVPFVPGTDPVCPGQCPAQTVCVYCMYIYVYTQRAQRSKKIEISSKIENFERERNFRASRPPRPYSLWGIRDVEIEIFERD